MLPLELLDRTVPSFHRLSVCFFNEATLKCHTFCHSMQCKIVNSVWLFQHPISYLHNKGPCVKLLEADWFLLLCRIHFPRLFYDFPGENKLLSLTNLFMRNTNVGFQSPAVTLEIRVVKEVQKRRYK